METVAGTEERRRERYAVPPLPRSVLNQMLSHRMLIFEATPKPGTPSMIRIITWASWCTSAGKRGRAPDNGVCLAVAYSRKAENGVDPINVTVGSNVRIGTFWLKARRQAMLLTSFRTNRSRPGQADQHPRKALQYL